LDASVDDSHCDSDHRVYFGMGVCKGTRRDYLKRKA
jgi:hypothetical protein